MAQTMASLREPDNKDESMKSGLIITFACALIGCATVAGPVDIGPDDSPEQAVAVKMGEAQTGTVGPSAADGVDWRLVEIRRAGRVRVTFVTEGRQNQLALKIYRKSTSARVGTLAGSPGQPQTMVGEFLPGTYLFEINGEKEVETISYTMMIEPATP